MRGGAFSLCVLTINLFIFNQVRPFRETIDTWVTVGGQCKSLYFVCKTGGGYQSRNSPCCRCCSQPSLVAFFVLHYCSRYHVVIHYSACRVPLAYAHSLVLVFLDCWGGGIQPYPSSPLSTSSYSKMQGLEPYPSYPLSIVAVMQFVLWGGGNNLFTIHCRVYHRQLLRIRAHTAFLSKSSSIPCSRSASVPPPCSGRGLPRLPSC